MITLELRPSPTRLPAAAFLIPGSDPRLWLDLLLEAAAGHWSPHKARLFALPAARDTLTPTGLFVLPPVTPTLLPPRVLPYAAATPALFHPVDAALYPPATTAELTALLTFPLSLFHPALGLVGFKNEDALPLADLLAFPPRRQRAWDQAVASPPPPLPLTAILVPPPPLEMILEQSRDDIGSDTPHELPPLPSESFLDSLRDTLAKWLNNLLPQSKPGQNPPQKPGKPSKPSKAAGQGLAARVTRALDDLRRRELERLLRMLENAPDLGLRHAIPLGDAGTNRGLTTPGATLGPHDVNFSLSALSGGRPADAWNIAADMQAKLRARYRALATREIQLGRYRRAAYILAQLLGDFHGAASALKQGRHFREAAALYKDKLHQPRLAAQCLEDAGLLPEAIDLYTALNEFEKVGDLYIRLEQPDPARDAYRTAVASHIAAENRPHAATLLESKLLVPDEALAVLDAGWPNSANAARCLGDAFALRARLARHEDAAERATRLARTDPAEPQAIALADILAKQAADYPDAGVRAAAADAARVAIGNALPRVSGPGRQSLTQSLAAADSGDRLLPRDTQRFLTGASAAIARSVVPAVRGAPPVLLRTIRLSDKIHWSTALSVHGRLFAAGIVARQITVAEIDPPGGPRHITAGHIPHNPFEPDLLLAPILRNGSLSALLLHGFAIAFTVETSRAHALHPLHVICSPAIAANAPLLGLAADDAGIHWAINGGDNPALSAWDMTGPGVLRSTHDLAPFLGDFPLADALDRHRRLPMVASRGDLFFAIGPRLVYLNHLHATRSFDLQAPVRRLVALEDPPRLRIAAVSESNAILTFPNGPDLPFATDMHFPLVTFTRGGHLIARDASELRIYETTHARITHLATIAMSSPLPVALFPTANTNEFATLNPTGLVHLFRLA